MKKDFTNQNSTYSSIGMQTTVAGIGWIPSLTYTALLLRLIPNLMIPCLFPWPIQTINLISTYRKMLKLSLIVILLLIGSFYSASGQTPVDRPWVKSRNSDTIYHTVISVAEKPASEATWIYRYKYDSVRHDHYISNPILQIDTNKEVLFCHCALKTDSMTIGSGIGMSFGISTWRDSSALSVDSSAKSIRYRRTRTFHKTSTTTTEHSSSYHYVDSLEVRRHIYPKKPIKKKPSFYIDAVPWDSTGKESLHFKKRNNLIIDVVFRDSATHKTYYHFK